MPPAPGGSLAFVAAAATVADEYGSVKDSIEDLVALEGRDMDSPYAHA